MPPRFVANEARFDLIKFPMAVPITDAFHNNMNNAPAPYKKEKTIVNNNTLTLLKNILLNILKGFVANPVVPPVSSVVRPFIEIIVDVWLSKSKEIAKQHTRMQNTK